MQAADRAQTDCRRRRPFLQPPPRDSNATCRRRWAVARPQWHSALRTAASSSSGSSGGGGSSSSSTETVAPPAAQQQAGDGGIDDAGDAAPLELSISLASGMEHVGHEEWDACATSGPEINPFVLHGFLSACEASRSAVRDEGWLAQHVLVREGVLHGLAWGVWAGGCVHPTWLVRRVACAASSLTAAGWLPHAGPPCRRHCRRTFFGCWFVTLYNWTLHGPLHTPVSPSSPPPAGARRRRPAAGLLPHVSEGPLLRGVRFRPEVRVLFLPGGAAGTQARSTRQRRAAAALPEAALCSACCVRALVLPSNLSSSRGPSCPLPLRSLPPFSWGNAYQRMLGRPYYPKLLVGAGRRRSACRSWLPLGQTRDERMRCSPTGAASVSRRLHTHCPPPPTPPHPHPHPTPTPTPTPTPPTPTHHPPPTPTPTPTHHPPPPTPARWECPSRLCQAPACSCSPGRTRTPCGAHSPSP